MEYKFTKENFNTEVAKSDKPVLIDFYADWCGPCKMMSPVVERLAKKYDGKVKVGKVNSDEQQELAAAFNVISIPNLFFIKDGKVVDHVVGVTPESVLDEKIQKML